MQNKARIYTVGQVNLLVKAALEERLVHRYINCHKGTLFKVNQLLQHIERSWEIVSSDEGDRTNNATERLIGLDYKIRAKTMRGQRT